MRSISSRSEFPYFVHAVAVDVKVLPVIEAREPCVRWPPQARSMPISVSPGFTRAS